MVAAAAEFVFFFFSPANIFLWVLFSFLPTEEILVCFWVRREQWRAAAVCHCFYIDILLVCLAGPLESPVLTSSTSSKGLLSLYI
jgi:hypothetical protein